MENISIRGKTFTGKVVSAKMHKTVVVQWERRVLIPKFQRYEKRRSKIKAHNPESIDAQEGDMVQVQQTRPLSKTKNFIVIKVLNPEEVEANESN